MKLFRLTFGLESPTKSPEECKEIAETIALASFPEGHTLIEAKGRWKSARGAITEDIIILTVIGPNEWITEVLYAGHQYKKLADQDAVLFTQQDIDHQFI